MDDSHPLTFMLAIFHNVVIQNDVSIKVYLLWIIPKLPTKMVTGREYIDDFPQT